MTSFHLNRLSQGSVAKHSHRVGQGLNLGVSSIMGEEAQTQSQLCPTQSFLWLTFISRMIPSRVTSRSILCSEDPSRGEHAFMALLRTTG